MSLYSLYSQQVHRKIERVLAALEKQPAANVAALCRQHDLPHKTFYWAMPRDEYRDRYEAIRKKRGVNPQKGRPK